MDKQTLLQMYDEPLSDSTVQHYCNHAKLLKRTQVSKALKFLRYNCIHYIGFDIEFEGKYTFVCLPLNEEDEAEVNGMILQKDPYPIHYNSSTYKISKDADGFFECNCQGWQNKAKLGEWIADGCMCSHVLSLMFAFKLGKFGRRVRA